MQIKAKVKYGNFKNVIDALSKEITVKVGLLAEKGGSDTISENLDMAGLGAVHEFGCQIPVTDKMRGFFFHNFGVRLKASTTHIIIPSRSFLQMPLERRQDVMRKVKAHIGDAEDVLYYIEKTGDLESVGKIIGVAAVEQILEAFETSGWGQWEPNNELTIQGKGSSLPLVKDGDLKRTITYEVEKNG